MLVKCYNRSVSMNVSRSVSKRKGTLIKKYSVSINVSVNVSRSVIKEEMFNSRTLLVGTLVGGNIRKYISKSVKNKNMGKEILTKKCTSVFIFRQNNKVKI